MISKQAYGAVILQIFNTLYMYKGPFIEIPIPWVVMTF